MTTPYAKPWLSLPDQVAKLESYGLVVANRASAEEFLRHLNYYRFSGYGLAFESGRHTFRPGTTFEEICDAYNFDRLLRDLINESLEVIELDLRSAVAYHFGDTYNAFGHTDSSNFFHRCDHATWLDKLHEETRRSKERFVEHYKITYSEYPDLPIWVATEIMSFGALSRMYEGMLRKDQQAIARRYGVQAHILRSWMHHLVYTRNLCAHHLRIWDRKWRIRPHLPAGNIWRQPLLQNNKNFFASLLVQAKLLSACSAEIAFISGWKIRIEDLIDNETPNVPGALARMGLSANWKQHPVWVAL